MKSLFSKKVIERKIDRTNKLIEKFDKIIASSKHSEYAIKILLISKGNEWLSSAYPPPILSDEILADDEEKIRGISKYALLISADRYEKNACNRFASRLGGGLHVFPARKGHALPDVR